MFLRKQLSSCALLFSFAALAVPAPVAADTIAVIGTGQVASALGPEFGVETSNAELIQAITPHAYVVKAFNTLNWRTMIDPGTSGGPVSIPLVGDNDEAKAIVASLVEGMDLEAIDLGPLRHAHFVEGMLILWINNRYVGNQPFDYYLRKVPKD